MATNFLFDIRSNRSFVTIQSPLYAPAILHNPAIIRLTWSALQIIYRQQGRYRHCDSGGNTPIETCINRGSTAIDPIVDLLQIVSLFYFNFALIC